MKIGINMLLWTTCVTSKNIPQLKAVKAAGADGVEVPLMEGDPASYREVGKILGDIGLEPTSCMAFVEEDQNPASPDPTRRQKARDYMKVLIDRADALGTGVIAGPMFQPLGIFTGEGPTAEEKERVVDYLRESGELAKKAGIALSVEPLNRFECYLLNTVKDTVDIVRRTGCSNVGILYDTFHANMEEKDPVGAIIEGGSLINHVHTCSNDRGIPGEDHIDWKGTFRALKTINYDSWLVIEAFGRALPGLAAATKIWRDMFDNIDDVAPKGIAFIKKQLQ